MVAFLGFYGQYLANGLVSCPGWLRLTNIARGTVRKHLSASLACHVVHAVVNAMLATLVCIYRTTASAALNQGAPASTACA